MPTQPGVLIQGAGCVAGVQTLDAETLQRVGPLMSLRGLSADGVASAAQLLAMDYAPPRYEGDREKLLMLITDHVGELGFGFQHDNSPRVIASYNPVFAVQFDISSGTQDWIMSIDACRGSRNTRNTNDDQFTSGRPHPGAIYRRRGATEPSVIVACHSGSTQIGTLVRIPLDGHGVPARLPVSTADRSTMISPSSDAPPDPTSWTTQSPYPLVTVGPDKVWEMVADPISDRVLLKVVDGPASNLAEVWWVYSAKLGQFMGTVGIGPAAVDSTNAVVDTSRGRLYVLAAAQSRSNFDGGLFIVDIRRTPIPQALVFDEFGHSDWAPPAWGAKPVINIGVILPPEGAPAPTKLLVPSAVTSDASADYRIIEDWIPLTEDSDTLGFSGRTLNLDESPGVTEVSMDGAARGYAARVLYVGGLEAAARVGPADPMGLIFQCNGDAVLPVGSLTFPCGKSKSFERPFGNPNLPEGPGLVPTLPSGCATSSPEIILGFIGPEGPAVVDSTGARGSAEPVRVDSGTNADLEAPVSRCSNRDWDSIGKTLLLGGTASTDQNGVLGEPRLESPWAGRRVECVSGQSPNDATTDDLANSMFAATSHCASEEASGFAYARGNRIGGLAIAEALSSFRIYRDPGRGIIARVESVARGINIAGVASIDTVRGVAESWANGRFNPSSVDLEIGSDSNCDLDRTAGTCFRRHIVGLRTPAYSCGPCGDEHRALAGLNRALGTSGRASLREPDPDLARGSSNGFIAAITKRPADRFGDLVLNNDLLQTVLPTLEIVRYAPANRIPAGGGPRGRQIYQFAGVEVSSSYSIQCLLVYDEETNTCAAEKQEPGSITINLSDGEGSPLAGGAFEVRKDVDADGVLGLVDSLVGEGACVTAEDGIGTCTFEDLQPGSYLVSQVAAPDGFSKIDEPWVSEVASGEARTVAFTNVSNVSSVDVTATDENDQPVAGAVFAVYPDPDADGKVAADAQPAATCTTGADGKCSMSVPVGSYVLVQTSAPGGLEGIEPVAFAFNSGGQTAAVGVTNYPAEAGIPQPEPQPGPIYTDPPAYSPPVETVDNYTPPVTETDATPLPQVMGDTIIRVIKAPGDALRLLSRDPQQAAAFTAALILFTLAAMAVRRRQHATQLMHH